ncbi:MAG: protein-P-II uridylyltransferase [Acidobacteria bacterium]|nr:protein-P-II uridylyltransferase [Acidobacteriota bacterium]
MLSGSPISPALSYRERVQTHAAARLTPLIADNDPANVSRTLRRFLKIEDQRLKIAHFIGASGCETATARSFVVDLVVEQAFAHARRRNVGDNHRKTQDGCALIAIGGYGRSELAPYSDVDLLFLYSGSSAKQMRPVLENLLLLLWDAGLTVGHSFRTVGDSVMAVRMDAHFQTALVKTRLLAGHKGLHNSLLEALDKDRRKRSDSFIAAIRREQNARHAKCGESVYLQEPNIKESAGGLRDFHTALWAAHARHGCNTLDELRGRGLVCEDEARRVLRAYDFLWRLRHATHFLTGRKNERLSLDTQPTLAQQFGYKSSPHLLGSEKLMRDYYSHARELHRFSGLLLARATAPATDSRIGSSWWHRRPEATSAEPFLIRDGHLQFEGDPEFFSRNPLSIFSAFALAQAARVPFDHRLRQTLSQSLPSVGPALRTSVEGSNAFMRLLHRRGRVGYALRLMHDVGFLARLIPEFGRISLLVQHDLYHHYTVDEHTLRAAEALDDLHASGNKYRDHLRTVLDEVEDPALLYLAVLLHDIGKGHGSGHVARGAKIAERIARRLGLKQQEAATLILLVELHVTMAHLAQRRDLNEPQVIADFAAQIGSIKALNMLLLLTYADLKAVGPGVWTEWKASLLWDLYRRTRRLLTGEDGPVDDEALRLHFKAEIAKALDHPLPCSAVERHIALLPDRYLRINTAATAAGHIRLIEALKSEAIAWSWARGGATSTELTICARDKPGLVADLAGTLAGNGIEILSAELNTREDGIAIDVFMLRQASTRQAIDPQRLAVIEQALKLAVTGELDVAALVERWRTQSAPRKRTVTLQGRRRNLPRVVCDNEASTSSTLIEVHAIDEVGLVHKIARALAGLGFNIVCARIGTEKNDALDVFYVTDAGGLRLSDDSMRATEGTLMRELGRIDQGCELESRI